jgi:hypothetical protein
MLAHHPTTGAPIRILRTEAHVYTNQKTLVWVRPGFESSAAWQRWFTVVSEPEALKCIDNRNKLCGVVIDSNIDIDIWRSELPTIFTADSECLLFAPNAVIDALAERGFSTDRALVLEDLYEMFPYLGEPLRRGDCVEKVIVSVAHILRMNRIFWTASADRDALDFNVRAQVDAWRSALEGTLYTLPSDSRSSVVPRVWLIQQYFEPTSHRRQKEINTCLQKNIECAHIDRILLLNEQEYTLPASEKIQTVLLGHRLMYSDVLTAIKEHVPAGDYVVFSNSDIYFDDSLKYVFQLPLTAQRQFLALLRWEEGSPSHIFGPRSDSQDAWIVSRDCVDFEITEEDFGFPFGKSGCDNALTLAMLRKRFMVSNPAYTIKSYHMHASGLRTYDPKDVLYKTHYLYVDPTPIHPYTVVKQLGELARPSENVGRAWKARTLGKSFTRIINSLNEDDVKTVCTMLRHHEDPYMISYGQENLWTPPPHNAPLYNFRQGVFVDYAGLVSDFRRIYIGSHDLWKSAWESAKQSALTSCIHVPSLVSVSCDERALTCLSSWALNYLPRVLEIRSLLETTPEFLVPQIQDIGSFLSDCVWPDSEKTRGNITVTPMMTDMNYYSTDVWSVPPEKDTHFVTAEDIQRLRSLVRVEDGLAAPSKPVIVFCVDDSDDAVLTRHVAEEIAEKVLRNAWQVYYVSQNDYASVRRRAFQHASWIVGYGDALEWMWYAPAGATVVELMNTWEPSGKYIHLAGAAGLRYVLFALKREPLHVQRQHVHMELGRAIRKFGFHELMQINKGEKPIVIIPTGAGLEGIMNHCGDTFREMVDIWADRGYVRVERREDTGYCWWGGVGEVLLYDRPTARWWNEKTPYQMALFGNCAPPGPGPHSLKQSVWGFWPRSPRAIEALVARGEQCRGFNTRKIKSLFLGKIENGVQMKARTTQDWSASVELFSMPVDSTGKPYPYTQTEYLDKLCNARFGLCLPGFGPKCNREIEYFACGCVPIVTPGVDMKGYLVPPKEGVHYLRAETPEQVSKLISSTSAEKWMEMSAAGRDWWRTYASAEGLFRLTWARIEQCRPFLNVGIPKQFLF